MPLIKDGRFVEDSFFFVPDGKAFPEDMGVMVTLARFQSEHNNILAHHTPVAVRLAPNENPEMLKDDLHRIAAVALEFASFRDGRPFSWARMLRTRLGYKGEVRGVGNFLYDQINYMHRTGFNAFEVPDNFTLAEYEKALTEMTNVYQPSVDGRKTIRDLRSH
jgi:uncharacterized protein (DUF934 family)